MSVQDEARAADPNRDLLGFEFDSDHGRLIVTGTPRWSTEWVLCEEVAPKKKGRRPFLTARSAALLRASRRP